VAKKTEESSMLSVLQDLFIFQLASAGVSQGHLRKLVGLDMNRVGRIARLAKKSKKLAE
jgi:hypothetical protein